MRFVCPALFILSSASWGYAHFSMLLSESAGNKKGEPITVIFQWGHPYEHQLFDAPSPKACRVIAPDRQVHALTSKLEKKQEGVAAHHLVFTPQTRGDYTFILETPLMWMPEDRVFLQDTVKTVVHVQAQKGWDVKDKGHFQIVPLTRPYGIRAGMVFQARVLDAIDVPQPGLSVFVERYNSQPPKSLPADELITFSTKTDPNGVLTCTLPEAGWWCVAAERDAGRSNHDGKDYPVRQRAILWVFVDQR